MSAELNTFTFKALDLSGVSTRGEVEAENKQHVAQQLRAKGLIVVDIEQKKGSGDVGDIMARFKRVKAQELTIASRQLSTMISSGMSLLRSLYVLEEQVENDKLKEALSQVRQDVEAGISFAEALARHPKIFNELYVAMVAAGETGGILEETLRRVADQLEKDDSLRRQVKAAMMYPSMIGGFAVCVLIALVVFLIPVFEKIFKDFGGDLPAITKFTVALSHILTHQWYLVIGVVAGTIFAFKKWKATTRGREQWDRFKLRIPFQIGQIVQKVCLARFSRTYSALIAAGVPMLQAIEITGKTSGNKVVEKAMDGVRESVKSGGTIAAPMRDEPSAFPLMVTQMIAVGEETGALESMLSKIADFYEEEVDTAVAGLLTLLEPIMIAVLGIVVGGIVIAMYLPIFDLISKLT
jgi:type IV pilus assembly protein PilC